MSVQLSPPQQTTSPPPPNPGPPTMPTPPFGTLVAPSSPNTPPAMATPPGSVGSGTHPLEHFRLQQLYTLALADRMRFLNPLWAAPRPLIPGGPPGAPPGSLIGSHGGGSSIGGERVGTRYSIERLEFQTKNGV